MGQVELECGECKKKFSCYLSNHRKYCSKECSGIASGRLKKQKTQKTLLKCFHCDKNFVLQNSTIRSREKQSGHAIKYCSIGCYTAQVETKPITCQYCKNSFIPKRKSTKFCSNQCRTDARAGVKKTGFWYENGYRILYAGEGKGIKEHIKIMTEHLGRELESDEIVHHKNFIRDDNDLDNLQLMTRGDHSRLHRNHEIKIGKKLFN